VSTERKRWLDEPRNVTLLFRMLLAVCLVLLAAEPFYGKHGHFAWEDWFGFHAFFGFAAFVVIVLLGKQLRRLVMRDEDYYDR
jgi:hypothetical protein